MHPAARRTAFLASLLLSLAPAFAQDAATTKPATRPATPDEQAQVAAYSSAPTDQPQQKRVWLNRDGSPRADFGAPDPGFMKQHADFLERGKQPADVLFLGDSITAGWNGQNQLWADAFGKYQPANFGIGGDRTEHVLCASPTASSTRSGRRSSC